MLRHLLSIAFLLAFCALAGRCIWVGWAVLRAGGGKLPPRVKRWKLARERWRLDDLGLSLYEEWLDSPEGAAPVGWRYLTGGVVTAMLGVGGLVQVPLEVAASH